MTSKLIIELLILALIAVGAVRIFFHTCIVRDYLSFCPVLAFVLALCFPLAWPVDLIFLAAAFLSVLSFFFNLPYIVQFAKGLRFSHFTAALFIASPFFLVLSLGLGALLVGLHPVVRDAPEITEKRELLEGSLASGLFVRSSYVAPVNGVAESLTAADTQSDMPLLIFVPDIRSGLEGSRALSEELALRGYEVFAAEIYSRDGSYLSSCNSRALRRFASRLAFARSALWLSQNEESFASVLRASYTALIDTKAKEAASEGRQVFLLGESYARGILKSLAETNGAVDAAFCIGEEGSYAGEAGGYAEGYGFIRQSDPWLAVLLGGSRDADCTEAALIAEAADSFFKGAAFNGTEQPEIEAMTADDTGDSIIEETSTEDI